LGQLYDHFSALLKDNGRERFFRSSVDELVDHVVEGMDVEYAVKRLGGGGLTLPAQHVLSFLAVNREKMAQDTDKPRTWLLKDVDMYDLATALPESDSDLGELAGFRFVKRIKDQLFTLVQELKAQDLDALWPPYQSLDPEQKKEVKTLSNKLNETCEKVKVARGVIANRKDIEAFVGGREARFQKGWRQELLGSWYE